MSKARGAPARASKVKFRVLTAADAAAFRAVRLLALQESPTAFRATFAAEREHSLRHVAERLAGSPDSWVLGAFAKVGLIGTIGFTRERGEKSQHKGLIWGMYVHPDWRGQGIGGALLDKALSLADQSPGLRRINLAVVTSNTAALRLYQSRSFVRYGEEPDALFANGVYHAQYHLSKDLSLRCGS